MSLRVRSGSSGELDCALVRHPAVFILRIGASTDQAQEAVAHEAVRVVRSYKETERFRTSSTLLDEAPPHTC